MSPLAPSSSACLLCVGMILPSESAKPLKSPLKCTVNLFSLGVLWSYEKKTIKVKPEQINLIPNECGLASLRIISFALVKKEEDGNPQERIRLVQATHQHCNPTLDLCAVHPEGNTTLQHQDCISLRFCDIWSTCECMKPAAITCIVPNMCH